MECMVCFQPLSLLIAKVWVPVMHFFACPIHFRVHWRVGRRLGSCRLISVQPLIGSTIWAFSISSALWVLEVLVSILTQFLSNRSQHVMVDGCWSQLVNVISGVPQGSVLGPLLFLLYTSELFSILENKLISYADYSTLMAVVPSPGIKVEVEESVIRDLGRVSEWCDLWGMKLNVSKTKTMINPQWVCINQSYSNRAPVTSGVPQGSVLGLLLFLIYLNDLHTSIVSKMSKFEDDAKLCHRARNPSDTMELQEDIHKLVEWVEKWQMSFNVDK